MDRAFLFAGRQCLPRQTRWCRPGSSFRDSRPNATSTRVAGAKGLSRPDCAGHYHCFQVWQLIVSFVVCVQTCLPGPYDLLPIRTHALPSFPLMISDLTEGPVGREFEGPGTGAFSDALAFTGPTYKYSSDAQRLQFAPLGVG